MYQSICSFESYILTNSLEHVFLYFYNTDQLQSSHFKVIEDEDRWMEEKKWTLQTTHDVYNHGEVCSAVSCL